jgi:excisionase family DNA binding protein
MQTNAPDPTSATPSRRRGRPKGSRNRPKPAEPTPAIRPAALRVEQAAQYLSVSVSTIRRLIGQRELEARRIGTVVLIPVRSLDRLLEPGRGG